MKKSKGQILLERWIGSPSEVPLHRRIFHASNLFTCFLLAVICALNAVQGAFSTAVVVATIGMIHGVLYYLSRVRGWFGVAKIGFVFVCYAGVVVNYFVNDGINGPSLLVFFFTFQLLVAVSRFREHVFYILTTCGIVAVLLFVEYDHPGWIHSDYDTALTRVSNVLIVFVVILLFFYWITRTLLDNYYRKQKESERHAKEIEAQHRKLKKITEEKEKLFSLVFHDLKSPLSSVQLYLQAISTYDIKAEADQRLRKNLLQLTKDTSAMLENVLTWISQQSEDIAPDLQYVECDEILDACLRIERPGAETKGIRFDCSLADNNTIVADPMMLQLIFRVFLNNAVKFSEAGQHINVVSRHGPDRYLISITDEGIGIPLEKQEKLFTPGIQSARGTQGEKGTGLGLLLAKQYADRQGITIHLISEPERGTTVTLAIPIHME